MSLFQDYPWLTPSRPAIVSAPMMKISLAHYALATSSAGGIGFLAGGFDLSNLKANLAETKELLSSSTQYANLRSHAQTKDGDTILPIGVGVQNWGASLETFIEALREYPVVAVWFFAPKKIADLKSWYDAVKKLRSETKVWVQIGSVGEAKEVVELFRPDVLVVQGSDAGGHGLAQRAGIVTLLPEAKDLLAREPKSASIPLIAAGGVMDGRAVAATVALGAEGVCMGTRLLASHEAIVAKGYQNEVLRAADGGVSTVTSTVYDRARGIKGWPETYAGRGVINQSYVDAKAGMTDEDNVQLYVKEMKKGDGGWGPDGRMTTYAGTGVGLIKDVKSIKEIVREVQDDALKILNDAARRYA